jgi:zinc transporter 5/7
MPVALAGFAVNLVGLVWFHDFAHGGSAAHANCSHANCAHAKVAQPAEGGGANLRGVFLHILADTVGSIGAIASTLLSRHLGWQHADVSCSVLGASCIAAAALPLLRDSSTLLLLRTPDSLSSANGGAAEGARACLSAIRALPHVREVSGCRLWQHSRARALGSLTVHVAPCASERRVASDVHSTLRSFGIAAVAVQVEKEDG